jgi:hypothetical protein
LALDVSLAAGVELSRAVVVGGSLEVGSAGVAATLGAGVGEAAAVSAALAAALGIAGAGLGVAATAPGVEGNALAAGSVFAVGVLRVLVLVLAVTELCVSTFTSAFAGVEREDGALAAFTFAGAGGDAIVALRLGAGLAAGADGSSLAAVSADAGTAALDAALLASATIAVWLAAGLAVFSVSFRL